MNNSLSPRKSIHRRGAALGSPPPPNSPPAFSQWGHFGSGEKTPQGGGGKKHGEMRAEPPPLYPSPPIPAALCSLFSLATKLWSRPQTALLFYGGGAGVGPAADVPQRGGGGRFGTPVLSFRCQHAEVSNAELRDAAGLGDPPQFCVSPPPPAGGLKTSGDLRAFLQSAICFQEFTAEQS